LSKCFGKKKTQNKRGSGRCCGEGERVDRHVYSCTSLREIERA